MINFNHVKLRYNEPCNFLTKRALVSQQKARSWLLRTLTFRIIWIYRSICQRLSLPVYDTHPTWLSLTNELKFADKRQQINSLSLVNLLLLINKVSFICEGQSCRVRITQFSPSPKALAITIIILITYHQLLITGYCTKQMEDERQQYWTQWHVATCNWS